MTNLFLASLIILAGKIMNFAVILANGGMPVPVCDYYSRPTPGYIPLNISHELVAYADIFVVRGETWSICFSIGDIVMILGGVVLFIILVGLRNQVFGLRRNAKTN